MKTRISGYLTATLILFLFVCSARSESTAGEQQSMGNTMDYRHIPLVTITGDTTSLASFTGKVVLIVNVASKCGFTPQYTGLEALYHRFKDKGLVIIGFPADNFKHQEPGTNEEILDFCRTNYNVTFPLMSKISVKGDDIHPLYRYLTGSSPFAGEITWNFNKFLLNRDGVVAYRFDSKVTPDAPELVTAVATLLAPQESGGGE